MESLKLSYCPLEEKPCVRWVEEYFKDCLCNMKDGISFALGIASLISWGVAEIPQIITNVKNKSADGVSLAFISTWIIGDVFNLVGCILEPATLPTQFYTAVLYTTMTVVLALQCLYYDHFLGRRKCQLKATSQKLAEATDQRNSLLRQNQHDKTVPPNAPPTEVPRHGNFCFRSARSLAGSGTPIQSYMKPRSGPPALEYQNDSSSEDENEQVPPQSNKSVSQPRLIPRSVGYGTLLATSAYLPLGSGGSHLKLLGRRSSLQDLNEFHGSAYGQWLGWLMAAIYMGGRIPQIWLNIKRGTVEGLNPLMFIFALIANATYVGSILVRSTEWKKIEANMPWLLDAVVCVGLDLFIILQYVYYRLIDTWGRKKKNGQCNGVGEYYEDYKEANKPLILA